jgi:crossover junction endodeoxyribonuclease RusA
MIIKLVVPGRPVPAVRMTQRGKFVKDRAQLYLNYKDHIAWVARTKIKKPLEGAVNIKIKVFVLGRGGDWDNYAKAICDGLNKIAYVDDSQIRKGEVEIINCSKDEQRVEIEIKEVA